MVSGAQARAGEVWYGAVRFAAEGFHGNEYKKNLLYLPDKIYVMPSKIFKRELNQNGEPHCEDGPALHTEFEKRWYINGVLHRTDGPAWQMFQQICKEGGEWVYTDELAQERWYINGKLHREDGPAIINYLFLDKSYYLEDVSLTQEEWTIVVEGTPVFLSMQEIANMKKVKVGQLRITA